MSRKLWLLPFLMSFCLIHTGCSFFSAKNRLCKVWFFTLKESGYTRDGDVNATSFLNIQTDGKYTACLPAFESGTWILKDHVLTLHSSSKKLTRLNIQSVSKDELVWTYANNRMGADKYMFDGFPAPEGREEDNPFSIENNQWRIKPSHKESDQELVARLRSHFRFWEKYFAWGLKINKATLNTNSTPTLLRLYSNGFQLMKSYDLSEEWQNCFYDEEDCELALDKVHMLFKEKNINWPETDNTYKLFISGFQQLQHNIQ